MLTMKHPSIAQCLNRMSSVHARILRGEKFASNALADARGWSTVKATLRKWGALENGAITDRGSELLTAWDARSCRPGVYNDRP